MWQVFARILPAGHQGLGGLRHCRIQPRDLQARSGGDDGIRQFVGCRHGVDRVLSHWRASCLIANATEHS